MKTRFLKYCGLLLLSVVILLVTLGAGCAGEPPAKPTVMLVENDWTSELVLVEIIDQITTQQLGYPTSRVGLSASLTWPAMEKGEVDLAPEIWLPGRQPEIQPFLDRGKIELAGEIFSGGSGWVIPRYVVEGDSARGIEPMAPGLKSILDLKEYWQIFENPENPGKGELVGGSPGWVDDIMDRSMILGYELPIWRSNQTEAIMMARMIAADKKGQPLLMYLWWPHWIPAEVDLIVLEEPDPWTEGSFSDEEVEPVKSGHPMYHVNKLVAVSLEEKAPEVYQLMQNMMLSEQEINTLMLRVDVGEEEITAVVADWISQNQDNIDQWLEK